MLNSSNCYRISVISQITWVVSSAKRPSYDTLSFIGVTGSWNLKRFVTRYHIIYNNLTTHQASWSIWATFIALHITVVAANSLCVAFGFLAILTMDVPIESGLILIWFHETRLCLPSPPALTKSIHLTFFWHTPKMSETSILYPPLPPPQSRSQHFQKNCAECTRSHRRCIFVSADHPKCTRCTKMHLLCCFVPSRESIYFHVTVLLSIFLTFYLFFSTWLDQGRRNDIILKKSREQAPPPSLRTHPFGGGLRSDDCQLTSGISERVHYPPSIHSHGLRGSSCCAVSKFPGNLSNLRPLSSHDVTTSSQAWFHVYSHKTANCSRCTQCAAVAHLPDGVPSSIRRSRICRAKKKLHKQQRLLREIVPPLDILNPTVSIEDIPL